MFEGSSGRFFASDAVDAGWLDGIWRETTEYKMSGEGLFKCKIQVSGHSRYVYNRRQEDIFTGPSLVFLNHAEGLEKQERVNKGVRERSLTFIVPITDEDVGGCSRENPAVDRAARDLGQDFYLRRCEPPAAAFRCVSAFFDGKTSTHAKDKFARSKVDELICVLLDAFFEKYEPPRSYALTTKEVRRAREARDIIMNDLSVTPQLNSLGRAVGLNRLNLNRAFREVFGTTVFQFLLEERMKLAFSLLEQGEDPGTLVASACGYDHYSNFSAAFKRFYKISPSAVGRH